MPRKYIAVLIVVTVVSIILAWRLSEAFIGGLEDAGVEKYNRVINIRPEKHVVDGQTFNFESLSPEQQADYFKFSFDELYFNDRSIDTFDPTDTIPDG